MGALRRRSRSPGRSCRPRGDCRHHRPAVRQKAENQAVLAVADEHATVGNGHVAGMKSADAGRDAVWIAPHVQGDQRATLARLDRRKRPAGNLRRPIAACGSGPRRFRMGERSRAASPASGRSCGRRGFAGRGCSTPRWWCRRLQRLQRGDVWDRSSARSAAAQQQRQRDAADQPTAPGDQFLQLVMDKPDPATYSRARTSGRRRDNRSRNRPLP